MMQKVSELFEATARNPCQIASIENGNAGFKIPEYQRPYDWSEKNIHRLTLDVFSGFERFSHTTNASAFTFLGTLILVKDQKQEPNFRGKSFSVVDGQQRLTTLTLFACALYERLMLLRPEVPKQKKCIENWLNTESDYIKYDLTHCIIGDQKVRGNKYYSFPRIIRSNDRRADNSNDEELASGIAKFLKAFNQYIEGGNSTFDIPDLGSSREASKIIDNFNLIRGYLCNLNDPNWYSENDCQMLDIGQFQNAQVKQLWAKTQDVLGNDGSSAINDIRCSDEGQAYLRTLMLTSYFCNCIALTSVITSDEESAFDIFDALNTTGEPLTALETLKPQVISAEDKKNGYRGSECQKAFKNLDKLMSEDYQETSLKQNETKELVVTFSLYLEGRKVSKELSSQRSELRRSFQKSREVGNGPEKFMHALSDVAKYRSDYWLESNNGRIDSYHSNAVEANEVKVLSAFISEMKTSMALPILARYWIAGRNKKDLSNYVVALKAVAAFLAIRRAATGSTDGIDTCFRDIMETGASSKKFGLCTGAKHENQILDLDELKRALLTKLSSSKVKFKNKDEWISHVSDVPIYNHAKSLARFLLFCGTHQTGKDTHELGLLTRKDIAPSDDRNYLSYAHWKSERYSTLEHVAPNSDKAVGWPNDIYKNARIKNTLGNLVLLPSKENSSIGNAPWDKKKRFFSVLTEPNISLRKSKVEDAKRQGMSFSKKTENLISNGERFSLLDGTFDVHKWDADFINKRSKRIAGLAWDVLRPWLE